MARYGFGCLIGSVCGLGVAFLIGAGLLLYAPDLDLLDF